MKIKMYSVPMHTDTRLHDFDHTKPTALERTTRRSSAHASRKQAVEWRARHVPPFALENKRPTIQRSVTQTARDAFRRCLEENWR